MLENKNNKISDVLKKLEENKDLILELGTGKAKRGQGWITLDNKQWCDIVHNLTEPFPFPDNTFPQIYCSHLLM
ncbi:MAG: hypothetical protein PVH61_36050 [Candidatus Aminicenantes bacterium]|jgi:predicted SAM-dependent methyltransferase